MKDDMVAYDGIYMSKMQRAGKKAAETRKKNKEKKLYGNRRKKHEIHKKIQQYVKEYAKKHKYVNIISLETHEYNLPTLLNADTYSFFIAQNDKKEFLKMSEFKNKPENISFLHCGCISDFCYLDIKPDFIFFDFCNTLAKNQIIYQKLHQKIELCNMIFVTACLRNTKKSIEDSKFDMSNKIHDFFPDYIITDAISYRDAGHAPMITFFLKNAKPREIDMYGELDVFEEHMCHQVAKNIKENYPVLVTAIEKTKKGNHINMSNLNYAAVQKELCKIYNDAIENGYLRIPKFKTRNFYCHLRISDNNELFHSYFMAVLRSNLKDVW